MTAGISVEPEPELADPLPVSPLPMLERWLEEARACDSIRNPDALALASVDEAGLPQVRMVLCRAFDPGRGTFCFYTNRESPKAREIEQSGRVSGVFYWDALGRQVRLGGLVERASDAASDAYFASRHPRSQIAACISDQSRPIETRAALLERFEAMAARFGGERVEVPIPRPSHWGGYVVTADRIELWAEREGRLHDRGLWTRDWVGGAEAASRASCWRVERLQP